MPETNLPRSSLVKIPVQRRSIDIVHAILDGAMRVIEREGMAVFTTNAAADAAGVSIGSLYQYFANKEMIVAGIIERSVLNAQSFVRGAIATSYDVPIELALRTIIDGMIRELTPYRPLMQELLTGVPLLSETSVAAIIESTVGSALQGYLLHNAHRYKTARGSAAFYVSLNSSIYMFLKWMVEQPMFVPQDEFVDALVHHATAALRPRDT